MGATGGGIRFMEEEEVVAFVDCFFKQKTAYEIPKRSLPLG